MSGLSRNNNCASQDNASNLYPPQHAKEGRETWDDVWFTQGHKTKGAGWRFLLYSYHCSVFYENIITVWFCHGNCSPMSTTLPGLLICDSVSASAGTLTKTTFYFLLETNNWGLFPSNKTKTQPNSQLIPVISRIGKKVKEIIWKSLSANRPQGKQQGNHTHLLYST